MRYELFLRRSTPIDDELLEAIRQRSLAAPLNLEPYRGAQGVLGIDLGVELDRPRAAQTLCELAFGLANDHGLAVFDPQLGRLVSPSDDEIIRRQLEASAAFASAAPVSPVAQGGRAGLSASARLWLVAAAIGLLALLLARLLRCGTG